MNYGFKTPVIDETHWKLGAIKSEPINLSGFWGEYLPQVEYQRKKFETSSCTGFGTTNCIEALMKFLFKTEPNFSDRGLGIFAGTDSGGNDPHTVAEAWRKNGLFQEQLLPFSDDLQNVEEYYSWKGGDEKTCRDIAKEWKGYFLINHEWVFTKAGDTKELMKEAIKSSPLGVSVKAWEKNGIYYTKPQAGGSNHWCMCYGYKEGEYWLIFDSYDATTKMLEWDYKFDFCKKYSLTKNTVTEKENEQEKLISDIIDVIIGLLEKIKKILGF